MGELGLPGAVLAFEDGIAAARRLAEDLQCELAPVALHRFPDGESLVTLPAQLPETIVVYQPLNNPNARLIELLLACDTARQLGAKTLILVAPYLGYMRQDKAFRRGQAISQRIIGDHLSRWVDGVVTVDPHLHRVHRLRDALPHCPSVNCTAAPLLGDHLRRNTIQGLLVGPDEESRQWVQRVADACSLDFVIAQKQRDGDRQVTVTIPAYDYRNRPAILIDDVISSGRTLIEAAGALYRAGVSQVSALCTHALYSEADGRALADAGICSVTSTDAVPHVSNGITLAPLLAEGIHQLLATHNDQR
ncbi:MAG: phosphoribosylpyrophosphate synthetase [Porticoccaceae bacterium]|nr:phosphoribosylpyrophosphate synthetase [Porticoccaceae bacterium]